MATETTKVTATKPDNAFLVEPEKLTIVGLDTDDRLDHPLYDERIHLPLNEAFVKNVMLCGVIVPVIIRRTVRDVIEVVDGRQRVRAAREANKRFREAGKPEDTIRVLCILKRDENVNLLGTLVSANEFRLDDTVLAHARKAARLVAKGMTMDEVALRFGVSVATVTNNWLPLLQAPQEVIDQLAKGNLSASQAKALVRAPEAVQAKIIKRVRENPGVKKGRMEGVPKGQSKPKVRAKLEAVKANRAASAALLWVLGDITDAEFDKALAGSV